MWRKRSRGFRLRILGLLALLVAGMGWMVYAPVRQERLNRALIVAIKHNDTQAVLALLAKGADPNARDEPLQHFFFWRLLLDKLQGKRPIPSTAPTALLLACYWNENHTKSPDNTILVKGLVDRGAALEEKDHSAGRTPLLCAVESDKTEVSTLLIERGANINASDKGGHTPLMLAAQNNNKRLVRLLLDRGADVNAIGYIGRAYRIAYSPLMMAQEAKEDDPAITEMLLSGGAKVNGPDTLTALDYAIFKKRRRSVRILLQHGADVNLQYVRGYTPLMLAESVGDKQIIRMLKQAGAKEKEGNRVSP